MSLPETTNVLIMFSSFSRRNTIEKPLWQLSYRFTIPVRTAKEAKEAMRRQNVGLVICESLLPRIGPDGCSKFIKLVRKWGHATTPIIVFFTSDQAATDERVQLFLQSGADAVISDPLSVASIADAMATAVAAQIEKSPTTKG